MHGSELLGTLAVLIAYQELGFSAFCRGCCWCFGFESERAMERCAVASTVTLVAVIAARTACDAGDQVGAALAPFRSALSLCSSFALMLSLLILSVEGRMASYGSPALRARHAASVGR